MQNRAETVQSRLILASSSSYRKIQLQQLVRDFECIQPGVNESPLPGETGIALVERLALAKASGVAATHPDAIVIGSDQAAILGGSILGKPGSRENARKQLSLCSGNSVIFETAVAIVFLERQLRKLARVTTRVEFRTLSAIEIRRYVEMDDPVDCAGSFKLESGGPALFKEIVSEDPTALIGLPLIRTAEFLREAGIPVP